VACYDAILGLFEAHRDEMDQLGVFSGTLVSAVSGSGAIIEPCLYWPDASNPVHAASMEPSHFAKLPNLDPNPEARAFVQKMKMALAELFLEHGAAHMQIGRTYKYRESLDPAADELLQTLKKTLDPKNLMNPGSLGL
jgi:FAD/FMN-containing dehydrogenase